MTDFTNKTIAVLVTNRFGDSELTNLAEAVKDTGATVHVISTGNGPIEGKNGMKVDVDKLTSSTSTDDYDALILLGGAVNANQTRTDKDVVVLMKGLTAVSKSVGVICYGGWILTDADALRGRTITSYISVETDLVNAGASWVDGEVVVDGNLISSRISADLKAFNKVLVGNLQAIRLSQDSSKEDCCHDLVLGQSKVVMGSDSTK